VDFTREDHRGDGRDSNSSNARVGAQAVKTVTDVRKGGLFRTRYTRRVGKVLRKGEGSVQIRWDAKLTRQFRTREGQSVEISSRNVEHISPATEIL